MNPRYGAWETRKAPKPQWSAKDQMPHPRATECRPRQDGAGEEKWTRCLKINVDSRGKWDFYRLEDHRERKCSVLDIFPELHRKLREIISDKLKSSFPLISSEQQQTRCCCCCCCCYTIIQQLWILHNKRIIILYMRLSRKLWVQIKIQ